MLQVFVFKSLTIILGHLRPHLSLHLPSVLAGLQFSVIFTVRPSVDAGEMITPTQVKGKNSSQAILQEMGGNSICLGTHPGNTCETPGKHPENTRKTPRKIPGKTPAYISQSQKWAFNGAHTVYKKFFVEKSRPD